MTDHISRARHALREAKQYADDWQRYGVERVHLYWDDVEGDWLDNFGDYPLLSSILQGYWPVWNWYLLRFEWEPTPALLQTWIDRGEIG